MCAYLANRLAFQHLNVNGKYGKSNTLLETNKTKQLDTSFNKWFFIIYYSGQKLKETNRVKISSDGSLYIKNTMSADSGNYSCRVENIYSSDEVTHELIVKGFTQFSILNEEHKCSLHLILFDVMIHISR